MTAGHRHLLYNVTVESLNFNVSISQIIKDYTETPENKGSSAKTWSVNYVRCRQTIHRHLEMQKIANIISYLPEMIMTYLRISPFRESIKTGFFIR